MGIEFHQTPMGNAFFNHQLPRLINALEKIADNKSSLSVTAANEFDTEEKRTKNFEESKEAINELSIVDIVRTIDYINELTKFVFKNTIFNPFNNKVFDAFNDIKDPLENVIKKCKTEKECPHCGHRLFKSDLPQYDYVCVKCDENFYEGEIR